MGRATLTIVVILLLSAPLRAGQWYPQNSGSTAMIWGIDMVDTLTGYASDGEPNNHILKTTYGGISWFPVSSLSYPREITFPHDADTGYAGTYFNNAIHKTTDGGVSWTGLGGQYPYSIFFLNNKQGWRDDAFSWGYTLRTTDGGASWAWSNVGYPAYFPGIFFVDSLNGYAGGGHYNYGYRRLYKSTDGGANWTEVPVPGQGQANTTIFGIWFVNFDTGWICTQDGQILKTTDQGANWTVQFDTTFSLCDLFFLAPDTGYVCGDSGLIFRTTDGETWLPDTSGTTNCLVHLSFPRGSKKGWVCGANGTILVNFFQPAHDVGVIAISSPDSFTVQPFEPVSPKATVKNFGTYTETFNTICLIESLGVVIYSNTQSVTNLLPGDTASVSFTAWTPGDTGNQYLVKVYSSLAGDENPYNDTLSIPTVSSYWRVRIVDDEGYGAGIGDMEIGSGRNDGLNRLYVSEENWGGAETFEMSYEAGSWIKGGIGWTFQAWYSMIVGPGRNDDTVRIYAGDRANQFYEWTYRYGSWQGGPIYGGGWQFKGEVAPGRNDGYNRVYAANYMNEARTFEFSYGNGAWSVVELPQPTDVLWSQYCGVGPGRNDDTMRVYATIEHHPAAPARIFEWTFRNNAWQLDGSFGQASSSYNGLDIGDGRNDGAQRLYVGSSDGHTYEFTYENGAWVRRDIGSVPEGAGFVVVGKGRNDNINRVYAGGRDGYLYEFTYSSGIWLREGVRIDTTAGWGVGPIAIGDVQNDGRNRVYLGCGSRVFELEYSISPVTIDLVADNDTIPQGGTLGFTITVTNTTFDTQQVQVWTEAYMPNGSPYPGNPVLGPRTVTLKPNQTITRHRNHKIPNNAPLGTYKYCGKVGTYPTPVMDEDCFNFTVTPP